MFWLWSILKYGTEKVGCFETIGFKKVQPINKLQNQRIGKTQPPDEPQFNSQFNLSKDFILRCFIGLTGDFFLVEIQYLRCKFALTVGMLKYRQRQRQTLSLFVHYNNSSFSSRIFLSIDNSNVIATKKRSRRQQIESQSMYQLSCFFYLPCHAAEPLLWWLIKDPFIIHYHLKEYMYVSSH